MRGPEPLRYQGRVYVRRGRSNDEPSASELQELYNIFGLVFTEERVVPGSGVDDIEPSIFRRYMTRKGVDLDREPQLPFATDLFNREVLDRDFVTKSSSPVLAPCRTTSDRSRYSLAGPRALATRPSRISCSILA